MSVDLIVAGGGPVGLGTAITAVLAGLDVAVVEPRGDPIDKACGEGLMPLGRRRLAALGVAPEGIEFRGIRYLQGDRCAEAKFSAGNGLGVRRTVLQDELAARAEVLGVKRVRAKVDSVESGPGWVEAAGVRGRWLAAADGLHSPTRRRLGLERTVVRAPPRFGLRRHYRLAPWSDFVEVHWAAGAEAYVTPVAPQLVGVAILCPGGAPYEKWLANFPAIERRLSGIPCGPILGAGPLRQRTSSRRRGDTFLVGDAAGYVDALTGEGIAVGLAEAQELIRCLVSGIPEDYDRGWRRSTRRYRALTTGLVWAGRQSWLRPHIVPAAQQFPGIFARIVNSLG